jgi:hypothetical protein
MVAGVEACAKGQQVTGFLQRWCDVRYQSRFSMWPAVQSGSVYWRRGGAAPGRGDASWETGSGGRPEVNLGVGGNYWLL